VSVPACFCDRCLHADAHRQIISIVAAIARFFSDLARQPAFLCLLGRFATEGVIRIRYNEALLGGAPIAHHSAVETQAGVCS